MSQRFYGFCRFGLRATIGWCYTPLRVEGAERVPLSGGVILAANHQSFLDPMLIGMASPRMVHFLARDSLFGVPILGRVIAALGVIPVKRDSGDRGAIRSLAELAENGRAVCLFPEGTRSETGALGPLKRGIQVLVKLAKVPVVPVGIQGTFRVWPKNRRFPRPGRVTVRFGDPLPPAVLDRGGVAELRSILADLARCPLAPDGMAGAETFTDGAPAPIVDDSASRRSPKPVAPPGSNQSAAELDAATGPTEILHGDPHDHAERTRPG